MTLAYNLTAEILDNLFEGVYYVNKNLEITYWNNTAEKITGYTKEEMIGTKCNDTLLNHIDNQGIFLCKEGCPLHKTLKDGKVRNGDAFFHHKDGYYVPFSMKVAPLKNEYGNIMGAIEVFNIKNNNCNSLSRIEELRNQSLTDDLTQIGNRRYFNDELRTKIYHFKEDKLTFGALFIDIDNFKSINDNYGHVIGDKVLIMVTNSIKNCIRQVDTLFRYGGDEFILLSPNMALKGLYSFAERIRNFVENSWFTNNKEKIKVTISIGGTIFNDQDNFESFVTRADRNMYHAKHTSKNASYIM